MIYVFFCSLFFCNFCGDQRYKGNILYHVQSGYKYPLFTHDGVGGRTLLTCVHKSVDFNPTSITFHKIATLSDSASDRQMVGDSSGRIDPDRQNSDCLLGDNSKKKMWMLRGPHAQKIVGTEKEFPPSPAGFCFVFAREGRGGGVTLEYR